MELLEAAEFVIFIIQKYQEKRSNPSKITKKRAQNRPTGISNSTYYILLHVTAPASVHVWHAAMVILLLLYLHLV
jgi:hypothetical protein